MVHALVRPKTQRRHVRVKLSAGGACTGREPAPIHYTSGRGSRGSRYFEGLQGNPKNNIGYEQGIR